MNNEDGQINYCEYTTKALHEAYLGIRADKYPKNFEKLLAELRRRGIQVEPIRTSNTKQPNRPPNLQTVRKTGQIKARLSGLVLALLGISLLSFRYQDGVYVGRQGHEYTFDTDPIMFTLLLSMHGSLILAGVLGFVFGLSFSRDKSRDRENFG